MTKTQRFGIISFLVLAAGAILVTSEPWKSDSPDAAARVAPPVDLRLDWPHPGAGFPILKDSLPILSYRGFDLAYHESFEQASWVAYVLTREEILEGTVPRSDDFRPDTNIISGSSSLEDYRRSGFDRGHLAPAADMKWDALAMSESFLMSNMSPQRPSFNRGIWRRLEESVRDWAIEKDSLFVITGPVLHETDSTIGENQVAVPGYYFKVLVDLSPPDHSFIAFLLPHAGSQEDLLKFAVTVDSLEVFTGFDFFAALPNQEAVEWFESQLNLTSWN